MSQFRVKKFLITADVLLNLGRGKFEVIANPLPDDARVCAVSFIDGVIELLVFSESFSTVSENSDIPVLTAPVISRIE